MAIPRAIRRPLLIALLAALVSLGLAGAPEPVLTRATAAGLAKPSGLKATVSAHSVALHWKAVRNAPAYRVQFSTRSDMKTFTTMDVDGTYLEWTHLDPTPSSGSGRLRPSTTYYFRVKVISFGKATLTPYGTVLKVKTASAKAHPELAPVALESSPQGATSMYLSWSSRGPGVGYRVRFGTTPKLELGKSKTASSSFSGTVLTGLSAATTYYYKVKTMSAAGATLSAYSRTASFRTPATTASPAIKVATYNVCSSECDLRAHPWAGAREEGVVANLAAEAPDVIALQEISRGKLGALLTDLNTASGRAYKTSDPATKGGSGTTRLAYDSGRFSIASGAHGILRLELGTSTTQKHAVWAILTDKQSGKRLFAVADHLIAGSDFQALRKTQAEQIVDLVSAKNTDHLPVVVAGDFNSSRDYSPTNVIYDVMSGAGYKDPLGNSDRSWTVSRNASAEHRIDLEYNSFNNFELRARRSKYVNGADIDYIWHSANVRVAMSRVVVHLDTEGRFVGVIPSDHNLMTAIIHLA